METIRSVGEKVSYQKIITIEEIAVKEELISTFHDLKRKQIEVRTVLKSSEDKELKEENILIIGKQYDDLINKNIGKDEVFLLNEDLWTVIDSIRAGGKR